MKENIRQNVFCGDWLWLSNEPDSFKGTRILLRKEFSLDSMISFADLRICMIPSYHLYINGFHVGYGQAAATMQECTGDHYDVAQYLDVGMNVIAVECFIHDSTTYFTTNCPPAFWCQLDINNTPVLWSNADWKIMKTNGGHACMAIRHTGLGKTIQLDLAAIPENWLLPGFDDSSWQNPVSKGAVMEHSPRLQIMETEQFVWSETELEKPAIGGIFKDEMLSTFISYRSLPEFSGGLYAAESFIYSEETGDTDLIISSDDPYMLFGNDMLVHRSDVRASSPLKVEKDESFKPGSSLLQTAAIRLNKGWNKLLFVQDAAKNSMGAFILFPGQKKGGLVFSQKPEAEAEKGWSIAGTFDLPFDYVTSSLFTGGTKKAFTGNDMAQLNDVSTFLHSCIFYPYDSFREETTPLAHSASNFIHPEKETAIKENLLREGEYIIYDLEQIRYGFLSFEFEGSKGDIVDVTPGIHFAENRIRSIGPMGRKTDTLRLAGRASRKDIWRKFDPVGARYIMVTARKCSKVLSISASFHSWDVDRDMDLGFQCSDPVLEGLWQQTMLASGQCVKDSIIDNPAGRCCQSLVECYLYSRSLYSFYGEIRPVSNALQQFARAQLPNGMIPGIVPSGIHTFAPDSSLVWILWLKEHWMADGDLDFLKSMLGVLNNLLDFFGISSTKHNGLLSTSIFGKTEFLNESEFMEEKGIFTALNALYCRALLTAGELFRACGKPETAEACRMRAVYIADAVQQLSFNKEKGLFADHSLHRVRSENYSVETNILALYGGLAPADAQTKILEHILESIRKEPQRFANSRILGFLLDTLFAFNNQEEALALIRSAAQYNKICENTPTYENLLIFPLTAGQYLIREVLGLRPAEPGMKKLYFNPACSCLQKAKGKVTNKNEQILVEWSLTAEKELKIKIDSNFPLEIVPVIPEEVKDCTFKLGSQVNILEPVEQ